MAVHESRHDNAIAAVERLNCGVTRLDIGRVANGQYDALVDGNGAVFDDRPAASIVTMCAPLTIRSIWSAAASTGASPVACSGWQPDKVKSQKRLNKQYLIVSINPPLERIVASRPGVSRAKKRAGTRPALLSCRLVLHQKLLTKRRPNSLASLLRMRNT